ncbi:MAG: DUF4364 family protein [Clostridia bacterium]|nr:DUF4364 family protein [Clostridia bacterium]
MSRRLIPDTEARLLLLLTLRTLGPASGAQLNAFLTEYDLMGYFDLQLKLGELTDQLQVTALPHPLGPLYQLTDEGLFVVNSYARRIPQSRRELIEREAPAWAERFRLEQQAPAGTRMLPGRRLMLELRLMSGRNAEILLIRLTLASPTTGAGLQERWQAAAAEVYAEIMQALSGDASEEGGSSPEAEARLDPQPDGRTLLILTAGGEAPGVDITLSLREEGLARSYAARWPFCAKRVKALLARELSLTEKPGQPASAEAPAGS